VRLTFRVLEQGLTKHTRARYNLHPISDDHLTKWYRVGIGLALLNLPPAPDGGSECFADAGAECDNIGQACRMPYKRPVVYMLETEYSMLCGERDHSRTDASDRDSWRTGDKTNWHIESEAGATTTVFIEKKNGF
jgi:hypothetical protein